MTARKHNLADIARIAGLRPFESFSGVSSIIGAVQNQTREITHYYDDDALSFFYARVVFATAYDDGVFMGAIAIQARNYDGSNKAYTYALHDCSGHCLSDAGDECQWFRSKELAKKAMHAHADKINAAEVMADILARQEREALSRIKQAKDARKALRLKSTSIRLSVVY